jgi:hypothetical protein
VWTRNNRVRGERAAVTPQAVVAEVRRRRPPPSPSALDVLG